MKKAPYFNHNFFKISGFEKTTAHKNSTTFSYHSNFGNFCLKISSKTGLQQWSMLKTAKLSIFKVLKHHPQPPTPTLSYKTLDLDLKSDKQTNMCLLNMLLFCKWEYSGESTWEAAYSLCSKGLQSLKVSNIWALPLMALPCNGYKLNLLTSASMCHMALNWKNALNFRMLFCLFCGETCETKK